MNEFKDDGDLVEKIWRAIHEISHALLEGGNSLFFKEVISEKNMNEIE